MNPSLLLIPDRYKASKLYSQIPDSGAGDLAFTRANDTATRVNSAGLIEKVRTNLILQSNTFSNAAWVKTGATTLTAGQADYLGGTTAWKWESNAIATIQLAQSVTTIAASANHSIFAKAGSVTSFSIWIGSAVTFDLSAGTITAGSGTITSVGNGWYRCSVNRQTVSSTNTLNPYFAAASAGDYIFISFAQTETGDIATPYIPTTTAAVSVGPVANIPRIDYTGGGCGKLLLEPQRTNLAQFSEQLDNAYWTKYEATITANASSSPDGFVNADKFIDSTANDIHGLYKGFTISVNSTFSIFVKAAEYSRVSISNLSDGGDVIFNLSTSTVVSSSANFINAKIENYADGWRRISATTSGVSGSKAIGLLLVNNSGVTSFAGTGTNGIFVYGAQLEEAAYPTSYIPTLGASVTRSADAASKTGISSLIGQASGTIYWEGVVNGIPVDQTIFGVEKEASNFVIRFGGDGTNIYAQSYNGSTNLFFQTTSPNVGQTLKLAFAYAAGSYAFYKNGTLVAAGTNASTIPACDKLQTNVLWSTSGGIGAYTTGSAAIYTTRLSNAELQTLTTL